MKIQLYVGLIVGIVSVAACSGSDDANVNADSGTDSGAGQGDGATGDTDATTGDDGGTGSDSASDAPIPPVSDAGGIAAPATQWTWVPFAGAKCRDGSGTGVAVNLNPSSTKVMLFLEGGGACFNSTTCQGNPSAFGQSQFDTWKTARGSGGMFNRADTANAVKDWSYVYVPYCTGDVHAGNNPAGTPPGVATPQAFVGYANIALYLQRIVPTFPGATQVLLTGESAGGFGAAANYDQVAKAFGSVPVDMLDDSGPAFQDPYAASCLQDQFVTLWGLDKTVIAACGTDCAGDKNFQLAQAKHDVKTHPDRRFGLVDSVNDNTIRQFLGFGDTNCTAYAVEPAATYAAGLADIRAQLAAYPNFGAFLFPGTEHTSIGTAVYDTRSAAGDAGTVKLTDWVSAFVSGTVTNVGP